MFNRSLDPTQHSKEDLTSAPWIGDAWREYYAHVDGSCAQCRYSYTVSHRMQDACAHIRAELDRAWAACTRAVQGDGHGR